MEGTGRAAGALSGAPPDPGRAGPQDDALCQVCELLMPEALAAKMQEMDAAMAKLHVTPPAGADAAGSETCKESPAAAATLTFSTSAAAAPAPMDIDPVIPPASSAPAEPPLRPRKQKGTSAARGICGSVARIRAGLRHHCAAQCLRVVSSHQGLSPPRVSQVTVNEGTFQTPSLLRNAFWKPSLLPRVRPSRRPFATASRHRRRH